MAIPVVAIVGRPNVGKSSLFNIIARSRTAIVEPTAGVTRDRISAICEIGDVYFELVDTGGHGVVDRDDLSEDVERQIQYAINAAQFILFVVDARDGLVPLDRDTAELLRRFSDRTRLIANKVDDPRMVDEIGEFAKLGFGEPLPVSATTGHGRRALFELITEALSDLGNEVPAEAAMKVAVVGKRNAGKSTFINALAGEERVIVSDLRSQTFYAKLMLQQGGKVIEVDSRPSDAIAIAVQLAVPIFVEEKVFEEVIQGQESEAPGLEDLDESS